MDAKSPPLSVQGLLTGVFFTSEALGFYCLCQLEEK